MKETFLELIIIPLKNAPLTINFILLTRKLG